MALMHFYAQLGMLRLGPFIITMPDEMDDADRIAFVENFKRMEKDPPEFKQMFEHLSESDTVEKVTKLAEAFMDYRYPMPTEQVYHSFHAATFSQKDYYLPALKVFNYKDGEYWSPARTAKWKNMELKAEHVEIDDISYGTLKDKSHKVGFDCDCGIYGSVNIEELSVYLHTDSSKAGLIQLDPHFGLDDRRLCIIEPSNNADVFVARKGWKTTKAFISEVIGETISMTDAAELLSMVWQRRVDVMKIYTMRKTLE